MDSFEIRNGTDIYSNKYGDVFWSKEGAIQEKSYIFLESIQLTERWKNKDRFSILELGFGAGTNLMITLNAWIHDLSDFSRKLTYISLEESPLPAGVLDKLYRDWELSPMLYGELLESYKFIEKGIHLFKLGKGTFDFYLVVGDALESLKGIQSQFDVLFLDGFSPLKNPQMWSREVFGELFRISTKKAVFTTYSSASIVKENAEFAGFQIEKRKGFGTKKWMFIGEKKDIPLNRSTEPYYSFTNLKNFKNSEVLVIGGGLAGTSIAASLANNNFNVHILERESALAQKTSGNPAGIINPNLTLGKTVISTLELNAYYYLQRLLEIFSRGSSIQYNRVGILSFEDKENFQKKIDIHSVASLFDEVEENHWNQKMQFLRDGAWIDPVSLCKANIESIKDKTKIKISFNNDILQIEKVESEWIIKDSSGNKYISEILVIANSIDSNLFTETSWLPIRKFRGQIIYIPDDVIPIKIRNIILFEDCYLIPYKNFYILGATYQKDNHDWNISAIDTKVLWEKLGKYLKIPLNIDFNSISGRVGIRATTPDHLPLVGPVPNLNFFEKEYENLKKGGRAIGLKDAEYRNGLFVFTGFGSKGILLTNYLSEVLTKIILGDYPGLEKNVLQSILPSRFVVRKMLKRKGY